MARHCSLFDIDCILAHLGCLQIAEDRWDLDLPSHLALSCFSKVFAQVAQVTLQHKGGHLGVQPQSIIQDSRRSVFPCRASKQQCLITAMHSKCAAQSVPCLIASVPEARRPAVAALLCALDATPPSSSLAGTLQLSPASVPGGWSKQP